MSRLNAATEAPDASSTAFESSCAPPRQSTRQSVRCAAILRPQPTTCSASPRVAETGTHLCPEGVPGCFGPTCSEYTPGMVARKRIVLTTLGSLGLVAAVAGGIALVGTSGSQPLSAEEPGSQSTTQSSFTAQSEGPAATPEPELDPVYFTIAAGGEFLLHSGVNDSAWNGEIHDYAALMESVQPWVDGADLAICHLEVPLAPEGEAVTTYPQFGAPRDLADSIKRAGWDGCSVASNHTLDRGVAGIASTLEVFDSQNLGHAGAGRTYEEAVSPQWYQLERDGRTITVAHISTADNTNGIPVPEDSPWSVQLLTVDAVLEQAQLARDNGADLVLVSQHCCTIEYTFDPEPGQIAMAEALAESGLVDALIGHHAHVPKPMELLPGGPDGDGMWVVYGTGNYISNQSIETCCIMETSSGIITYFDAVLEPDGHARITGASWKGITVDRRNRHNVLPLNASGAEGAVASQAELQERYRSLAATVGKFGVPELMDIPQTSGDGPNVILFDEYEPAQ